MNRLKVFLLFFLLLAGFTATVSASEHDMQEKTTHSFFNINRSLTLEEEEVLSLIKPSPVIAKICADTPVYNLADETSGRIAFMTTGETVEILQDSSAKWYKLKSLDSGKIGWVESQALTIEADSPSDKSRLTADQLESYANLINLPSKTNYLVICDIGRQLTYIFVKSGSHWKYERSLLCSTGKNESPTTRGIFYLSARGKWFYSERLGGGAKYWVRFNGSYLFHSVAMDKNQKIIDGVLGEKRSSGCIRLSLTDAEWFYQEIPDATTVIIV